MKTPVALVCLIAASLALVCGCGRIEGDRLSADYSGSGPGALRDARTLRNLDLALVANTSLAARITYTSTSGVNDNHPDVTGAVFVPLGDAPPGGWPIVAFGHPATGIAPACAPSSSSTLMGTSSIVAALFKSGYVVAMADYQGLGSSGTYHPYLDSSTVGHNLIDAVLATRKLVPNTSTKWIAFGVGQGGQGAWAANELFPNHGVDLQLLGAASLDPISDITGLADAAVAGQLTNEQKLTLMGYLDSLNKEYNYFNLDDYRRGAAEELWATLSTCQDAGSNTATTVTAISPGDLRPSNSAAEDTLRGFMQKTNLPQAPAEAPMLVSYGDQNALNPAAWTEVALGRACRMGDVIQIDRRGGTGLDVDMPMVVRWIGDRFAGVPPHDDCPAFIAA